MVNARALAAETLDQDLAIKDFAGINTQAQRTAIDEKEFSWLENVMPVGYANLRCIPAPTLVATIPAVTINYWKYANIGNVDFQLCFNVGGGGHALNLATFAVTVIAAGGTFVGQVSMAQWKNERALIVAANGYWSWDPIGGLVALASITGAPAFGALIATYAGRVWIGFLRTVTFSGPNSYQDFTTASSGGAFIVTDETLHSNITALFTANNFLYIAGSTSFNIVSDVRLGTGTPTPTLFSNTNISALIGSSQRMSIFAYYRLIAFVTDSGFYVLNGATPRKISDKLDGVFRDLVYQDLVSGGPANIYQILCLAFLFRYNDAARGERALIAILFNDKWFLASQGDALTLIAGGFQAEKTALFGTDGTNIYKLFSDTTAPIDTKIQTALWPMKEPTRMKEGQKAGVEVTTVAHPFWLSLSLDSDFGTVPVMLSATNTGQWFNAAGQLGQWFNAALVTGDWIFSGFNIFQGDAEFKGRYLGFTMTSQSPAYIVEGFLTQYSRSTDWATRAQ
jgi:hypothetical protein